MLRMLLHPHSHPHHRTEAAAPILLLLVLLVVDNKCMAEEDRGESSISSGNRRPWEELDYYDDDPSSSSSSSSSFPMSNGVSSVSQHAQHKTFSNTQSIIELVGPKKYVALGGNDLIILYRLSPSSTATITTTLSSPSPIHTSNTLNRATAATAGGAKPSHSSTSHLIARESSSSSPITGGRRKLIMYLTLEDEAEVEGIGNESETLITKQVLAHPPTTTWQEVHFDCGWIVYGANYKVTLMEELDDQQQQLPQWNGWQQQQQQQQESIANTTHFFLTSLIIHADYPSIDFEVPHRLESYTASVPISIGLTKTLCKPKLPLPATQLTLNLCKQADADGGGGDGDDVDHFEKFSGMDDGNYHDDCGRIFAVLATNPLDQLEKEGQITMTIGCSLWGRSGYFRVQLGRYSETYPHHGNHHNNNSSSSSTWIARSEPIKVDWSSRFQVGFAQNRKSIIPCPETESVVLEIDYPSCVINGLDKIRVYGYETLPLPSMLAPKRLSYIREELIPSNTHHISFSCTLFPQRFSRYCFQYVNTAVDGSVAVVVENCIPALPPELFSDGGWGPWSSWSPCSATCGKDGRQFRYRFCDSPLPSFGANYCQGDSIEESECDTLPDCSPPKRKPLDRSSIYEDDEYLDNDGESGAGEGSAVDGRANTAPPFLHINNLNYTFRCECGCLIHDLVPGFNYSLIVTLSPAQSHCEDEDEEEHHNLKWILHAKGDGNRIRFLIVGVDLQCMTLSFRDGNTTDSNLLEVMTMSTQYSLLQPSTPKQEQEASFGEIDTTNNQSQSTAAAAKEKEKEKNGENRRLKRLLHIIESTGASLSIATSESTQNCSTTPTVYFVAYYHIVPAAAAAVVAKVEPHTPIHSSGAAGIAERHSKPEWNMYEFWSFLFIKFVLTFFVIIILFTTFGGFATKIYRRAKYKQLTWIVTDDDKMNESQSESGDSDDSEDDEEKNRGGHRGRHRHRHYDGDEYDQLMNNGSRNTSVTLMSFDQSYWKQLRTLRLKHFLLAPRRKHVLTKVKSYPSTPVHGKQIKLAFRTADDTNKGAGGEFDEVMIRRFQQDVDAGNNENYACKSNNDGGGGGASKSYDWRHKKELNKLTSLSDSNLKNMKRVNLRDIISNDEDGDGEQDEGISSSSGRVVQCYRSRKGSSSRPSSIIIVRSKSSNNAPIMPHALSSFPWTTKNCSSSSRRSNGLCDGTCATAGGGDKCNCSCITTSRNINDINTRGKAVAVAVVKEEGEGETKGKRRAVMAIMKRKVGVEENEKIRKEKENLKRREIEMSQIMSKEQCAYTRVQQQIGIGESGGREKQKLNHEFFNLFDSRSCTPASACSSSGTCSTSGKSGKNKHRVGGVFDSQSSIPYSIKNSSGYLYTTRHGGSRDGDLTGVDDDEQDFEMDYYDYDASNAANIPGSLFGMEPAFVLWNSEMFSQDTEEEEGDNITVSQATDELPGTISSSNTNTNTNYDNDGGMDTMTDNGEEEEDDEMLELITTTTDSNVSSGSTAAPPTINKAILYKQQQQRPTAIELQDLKQQQQQQTRSGRSETCAKMPRVREISLDTLKFVDDAEFDEEV